MKLFNFNQENILWLTASRVYWLTYWFWHSDLQYFLQNTVPKKTFPNFTKKNWSSKKYYYKIYLRDTTYLFINKLKMTSSLEYTLNLTLVNRFKNDFGRPFLPPPWFKGFWQANIFVSLFTWNALFSAGIKT